MGFLHFILQQIPSTGPRQCRWHPEFDVLQTEGKNNSVVGSSDHRTATSSTELSRKISFSISPTCLSWCSCAAAPSGSLRSLGGLHPWPPPRLHSLWGQTPGLNLNISLHRLHISHSSWIFNDFYVTVKLIVFKVLIVFSRRNSTRKRELKQIF